MKAFFVFFTLSAVFCMTCSLAATVAVASDVSQIEATGTQKVSFESALQTIIERSTDLRAQNANYESAAWQSFSRKWDFVPDLSIQHQNFFSKIRNSGASGDSKALALTASYTVLQGGSKFSLLSAANANKRRQKNLVVNTYLEVEAKATTAIFRYINRVQLLKIAGTIYESQKKLHAIALSRYGRGLAAKQEVDKIFIDMQNSLARVNDARVDLYAASSSLDVLLGHHNVATGWPWDESFFARAEKLSRENFNPQEIPAVRAQIEQTRALRLAARSGWQLMLPSMSVAGNYYFDSTTSTLNEYSASLTVSLPIFDQLTLYSSHAQSAENRRVAEANLVSQQRVSLAKHAVARDSLQTRIKTALTRAENLLLSQKIYRDNERRFKSGRINANELILDQERLLRTEQFATNGWLAAHTAFVELCHSLGKRLADCQ